MATGQSQSGIERRTLTMPSTSLEAISPSLQTGCLWEDAEDGTLWQKTHTSNFLDSDACQEVK